MKQIDDFKLYLITDRHQTGGRSLFEVVRSALAGGVRAVQLREKDLSPGELYSLATEMRRLTLDFDARLIINDHPDIAIAVGADGVHVGVKSLPVAIVRSIIGQDRFIGYSAHNIDEALRAEADGADFVTFSPVHYTPSKALYGLPCGIKKLEAAVKLVKVPVIALGGISLENITETLSAGIDGVALISAVLNSPDPFAVSQSLIKKIEEYA
ncbi:MAG: thiamine phosphate synthase [Desulfuromonadaceae bacterium]|nr:thiamine phosphate synthase [Desulfuromonadaceae bacterium]MDD2856766.1 thiamine phosphate synthase [Desulfuromonadaceae bacterium]